VTGNDVTWPQVTGSNPQVTSFDRKSPGSGCRRPKTGVYSRFHFLQGGITQEEAVTWEEMTSRDLWWPKVTRKWRHLNGSHLEVAVEGRILAYTVHFTFYKAVARFRRQSCDRKWRHVTSFDRKWPRSDVIWPEVTWNGCRRLKSGVNCTFHFLQVVTRRKRQSRDSKWRHVTLGDRKWPGSDVIWSDVTWNGFRRLKCGVNCTFHFLQVVARRGRQSRDSKWRHVTSGDRKSRHLTGCHLEVAVEGRKLAYTVHFSFYKAVARRRRQSRDRKWRHVTSGDRKWRHFPGSHLKWL